MTKANDDGIIHDLNIHPGTGRMQSASDYGHPTCSPTTTSIAEELGDRFPTGPAA